MGSLIAWIEETAASQHCVLKSFGVSLVIVIVGFFMFLGVLEAIVHFRHLTTIPIDLRNDPWFRYLGFVAPSAFTLLSLFFFHLSLFKALIRNRRYSTFACALALNAVVGLVFIALIAFCWLMY